LRRSSDTIATIAAALAKAQVEITNPEKPLTGMVAALRAQRSGRIKKGSVAQSTVEKLENHAST
jgi:hypothetical protein